MDELSFLAAKVDFRDFDVKEIVSILLYDVEHDTDLMSAYNAIASGLAKKHLPCSEVLSVIAKSFHERYIDTKSDSAKNTAINYVGSLVDKLTEKLFTNEEMREVARDNLCEIFQVKNPVPV